MKKTVQQVGSSFFHETVTTSANKLIKILGEPEYGREHSNEKVQFDWEMETDDGDYFTVYDWKEYRKFGMDTYIVWHVGGVTAEGSRKGKIELLKELK